MSRRDSINTGELTDFAFYILASVIEEKHGYLIMKSILEVTEGKVNIGPASLYTTLKKLLEANLIELISNIDKNKKVYKITEKGKEMLSKEIDRKKEMIKFVEKISE